MAHEQRLHMDISKAQAKGLKLDQEITLTVMGKLVSLSSPDEYAPFEGEDGKKEERLPSIAMTVAKVKVAKSNAFAKLSEDDDEED